MEQIFHIRTKKDYVISLLNLLKKDEAIEDLETTEWQLTDQHKKALDKEIDLIQTNPTYLKKWDDVKQQFKKS